MAGVRWEWRVYGDVFRRTAHDRSSTRNGTCSVTMGIGYATPYLRCADPYPIQITHHTNPKHLHTHVDRNLASGNNVILQFQKAAM
jgi:hypothetical protein